MNQSCTLCQSSLPEHRFIDGDSIFCCHGCRIVYQILCTKNQLTDYRENPLFLQAIQSGLISNPVLIDEINHKNSNAPINELERIHLEIQDLWCPACAELIKLVLMKMQGVKQCVVDYTTDLASIEFFPRSVSKEDLYEIIRSLGYRPLALDHADRKAVSFSLYLRFIIAAFFTLNIMMLAYPLYATFFNEDSQGYGSLFAWTSCALSLPVLTYSAWPIFQRAWHSLLVGLMGMEALVVIGVISAFGLSIFELLRGGTQVYFDSMTTIITFVLLGKIVEAKAKFSAKESLFRLSRSIPRRGRKRFANGEVKFVPVKEIKVGDVVVAGLGEKIVLDGVVIEGEGCIDESLMTGEAVAVMKNKGCTVLGGTMLQQGSLVFRVISSEEETALHKIMNIVKQDIGHKSVYLRPVDSIIRWFVPAIIFISLLTAFTWATFTQNYVESILTGISVLLISCPCAIGIAAPLAESKLLQSLAEMGVIVRNRGCLPLLGNETQFIFDKTGTITEGNFRVQSGLSDLSLKQLQILKSLSCRSSHPIARAISKAIMSSEITLNSIKEFPGLGMEGVFEGQTYKLGSAAFVQAVNIDSSHTQVYFYENAKHLSTLILGDQLKNEAATLISTFEPHTILLSGDSEAAVKSVALACQFKEYYYGLSPLQKRDFVDALRKKGEIVAMLGDGVNDAPALTRAHIGISVVSATDMSIQVSDILLTTDRLSVISNMRSLAKKGQRIVKENLFWAFIYNGVGVGLAAFGYLHPIFAAGAMVMSSLIVILNAQRVH